jgi:hypothetical protein
MDAPAVRKPGAVVLESAHQRLVGEAVIHVVVARSEPPMASCRRRRASWPRAPGERVLDLAGVEHELCVTAHACSGEEGPVAVANLSGILGADRDAAGAASQARDRRSTPYVAALTMAAMAALGVRSARWRSLAGDELAADRHFHRMGANGRERSPALAMQKVVGSSPIIRFHEALETAPYSQAH